MLTYSYRCEKCGDRASLRRLFTEMDDPAACLSCGGVLVRHFTPNANIHIPTHFKSVRPGGVEGNYSWSDFHSHSEKELAHLRELDGRSVEVVPVSELRSRAAPPPPPPDTSLEQSLERAVAKLGPLPSEE